MGGDEGTALGEGEKLNYRKEWLEHWRKKGFSAWREALAMSLAGDLGPHEVSPFPLPPQKPKVALVYALGPIVSTKNQGSDEIDASKVGPSGL